MQTTRVTAALVVCLGWFLSPPFDAAAAGPSEADVGVQSRQAPPAPVRMGRVVTASHVVAWGNFVAKTRFLPGETVWIYAEAIGVVRNDTVDAVFRFDVAAPSGEKAFQVTAEFNEPSKATSWAAWRSFTLATTAPLGAYSVRVDVEDRRTGDRAMVTFRFEVASAATVLPADTVTTAAPAEALSPEMEEAFAGLRLKRYDEAVRLFRKALDKEPASARGYIGLGRCYEGLGAFKNQIEAAEKAIACAKDVQTRATALNLKGLALYLRGVARQPPDRDDLALADEAYQGALGLDPGLDIARYNLGILHLRTLEDSEGVEWLRAYLAAAPKGPYAADATRYIENPRRARENYAPDFSLVTSEGEHLDLESLRGKVVILDFWASWCGPCKETLPTLRKLAQRHAAAPFVLISISVDRDAGAWRRAVAADKMTWPQHLDAGGAVARLFKIQPIPTTIVLDGDGIVRDRIEGYSSRYAATLDAGLRKWLRALTDLQSKAP
jgi:thiol-disulfide isomerase/thioredoxin/Tfp pilus assembly protein PilF